MLSLEIIQSIKRKPKENDYPELSNIDAEIALIGCLLRENKYFEKISDFLLPEHFTNPLNSKLFSVIEKLINQNQLVSPITLKNYFSLSKDEYNIDVFDYLKQIKDSTPSMINAFNYGKIIYDLHIKRSFRRIRKNEQHAAIRRHGISMHQPLFNGRRFGCHFNV